LPAQETDAHEHADHDHGEHDHDAHAPTTMQADKEEHEHDEHDHGDEHDDAEHDHGDDEHADEEHGHAEHADEVKLTPQAIERYGIQVEPVTRKPLASSFVAAARVAFNAEAMAHVGSVVTGRIVELKAKVGVMVERGGELFVIESPELAEAQSEFLQRRTAVAVAKSAVQPAENAFKRAHALYEKNEAIALAEVQKREAEWKAAEGALLTAVASVTAAENKLHMYGMDQQAVETLASTGEVSPRFAIRAPIAGQIIEREVTLGELVSPERDALLVLADMSHVWVLAEVPEAKLASVSKGSKARVTVAARSADVFEGTVAYVAPVVNPDTRTASVRIEVPNEQGQLRPGMFARVEIITAS
jgi:cobalt-zinc-cadmium efflux system membrane fusion protein